MDERAKRLQRMKLSQSRLREQRAQEVKSLRNELQTVKAENNNLQTKISDRTELIEVSRKAKTLTNHQIRRMVELFPAPHEYYVSMEQFMSAYGFDHPSLVQDDVFILKHMHNKMSRNFITFLAREDEVLKQNPNSFKYIGMYGPSLAAQIVKHIEVISNEDRVPSLWLEDNDSLPRGVVSIVEALIFLKEHLDVQRRSFEILAFALIRYGRITPYGLVYLQKDLDWCIDVCYSPKLDTVFLSELSLNFDNAPESLIEKLVKQ